VISRTDRLDPFETGSALIVICLAIRVKVGRNRRPDIWMDVREGMALGTKGQKAAISDFLARYFISVIEF